MDHIRLAYRGGNWTNTSNAGVFNLNGNNPRSNSNTNIGFRSALLSRFTAEVASLRGFIQSRESKGVYIHAKKI